MNKFLAVLIAIGLAVTSAAHGGPQSPAQP